jgi:hypothetical protein
LQALNHCLDDLFGDAIRAGFAFPEIEHFGEAADDGRIVIAVFVFEVEKFTEFF